jgi:predicted ATPase
MQIESLRVAGFLSLKEAEISFDRLNVLIGSNGAGKSNLLRLFELLQALADGSLQTFVARSGGADALLHYGRKHTQQIEIHIRFQRSEQLANGYKCRLIPAAGDILIIDEEFVEFHDRQFFRRPYTQAGHVRRFESALSQLESAFENPTDYGIARYVRDCLRSYRVYHFHDTSPSAPVKQRGYLHDNIQLHHDARNLAAMLYRMREEYAEQYAHLLEVVRLNAPFLHDFVLEPLTGDRILLRWRASGSEVVFGADALSDGTLRYICLCTLLIQPPEWRPSTILIDEPELGLHPFAITVVSELMRAASQHTQLIISTQSPLLLNQFEPSEIIVVERHGNGSEFRRLSPERLEAWLKDYTIGELWEKNLIGGRPPR